jgi:hypothetical protein
MRAQMTEQRLNFSDYSAEEQERDAERHAYLQKKYQPHAFLLKVSGTWAHITFDGGEMQHKFYDGMNLYQMFNEIKQTHPNHKLKYVINQGLENYLRDVRQKEQAIAKRQLTINFNGGKDGY